MTAEPLVSIVVPVYNVERYLSECLNSICNQTYRNLQIILVDDGATDSSGQICDLYASKDSRIEVIHQQNQGAAVAKNTGLDAAAGEFIWLVDADDYLCTDALSLLLRYQKQNDADVVVFGFFHAFTNGTGPEKMTHTFGVMQAEDYLERFPKDWTCSLFWNKLFRRSCIGDIRFKNERRCIDDEFFTYRIFFKAKTVQTVDENLYFYRQRKGSVTKNSRYDRQRSQDALDCMEQQYQDVRRAYPKMKKGFLEHQFSMLVYMTGAFYTDETILAQIKHRLWRKIPSAVVNGLEKGEILAAIRILLTPIDKLLKKNTYTALDSSEVSDSYFE